MLFPGFKPVWHIFAFDLYAFFAKTHLLAYFPLRPYAFPQFIGCLAYIYYSKVCQMLEKPGLWHIFITRAEGKLSECISNMAKSIT